MIKIVLIILVFLTSLTAGLYDDNYNSGDINSSKVNDDSLFNGDFEKIIRFDEIYMSDNNISNSSLKLIDDIASKIKEIEDNNQTMVVSIIGHTKRSTDDKDIKIISSKSYGSKIVDFFTDKYDTNSSLNDSKTYAQIVADKLFKKGLDQNITQIDYRGGEDILYTQEVKKGQQLSNRVMVAIYIKPVTIVPIIEEIVELDSDGDGVLDKDDECPNTLAGLDIDPNGCHIYKTLHLTFKRDSDEIDKNSIAKVEEFAAYLASHNMYNIKIIGHTDSVGSEIYNQKLSEKRALKVKNTLIKLGIDPNRMEAIGMGELQPIASNMTAEGKAKNRRIEVKMELNLDKESEVAK